MIMQRSFSFIKPSSKNRTNKVVKLAELKKENSELMKKYAYNKKKIEQIKKDL